MLPHLATEPLSLNQGRRGRDAANVIERRSCVEPSAESLPRRLRTRPRVLQSTLSLVGCVGQSLPSTIDAGRTSDAGLSPPMTGAWRLSLRSRRAQGIREGPTRAAGEAGKPGRWGGHHPKKVLNSSLVLLHETGSWCPHVGDLEALEPQPVGHFSRFPAVVLACSVRLKLGRGVVGLDTPRVSVRLTDIVVVGLGPCNLYLDHRAVPPPMASPVETASASAFASTTSAVTAATWPGRWTGWGWESE